MIRVGTDVIDRSRAGNLIHEARSQGRIVFIVAYIEGVVGDPIRRMVESQIICRTSEQAASIAQVLRGTINEP